MNSLKAFGAFKILLHDALAITGPLLILDAVSRHDPVYHELKRFQS